MESLTVKDISTMAHTHHASNDHDTVYQPCPIGYPSCLYGLGSYKPLDYRALDHRLTNW